MNTSTTQPPAPQLALIALSEDISILDGIAHRWRLCYLAQPEGNKIGVREISALDRAIATLRATQSRPEAELPEITDERVERALAEIGDFQFCPKLTDRKAAMRAAFEAAFPRIHGDVTDAAVQKALDAQPFTEENHGTRVWQTFLPEYQEHLCKQIMRAAMQAAYGQQCAATRPAEVGGDRADACRYRALRKQAWVQLEIEASEFDEESDALVSLYPDGAQK